jgi:hypothetical protein
LGGSYRKIAWQFVRAFHVLKIFGIHFLGVRRSLETKIVRCDFIPGPPVSDLDAVLRCLIDLFAGDDISARIWPRTLRDPNLPIDLFGSKS